jgi:UDP-N-acetylglucosamine diphosphorylase/glucosamine-1-phosphate N-acetyltransferase
MRNVILFDDEGRDKLLPLVYTKPTCELRCGILTIREKWEIYLNASVSYITQEYLIEKYPIEVSNENLLINGTLLPNPGIAKLIMGLNENEAILCEGELLAARLNRKQFNLLNSEEPINEINGIEIKKNDGYTKIYNLWDIFQVNGDQIRADFELLTKNRKSSSLSDTNRVIGKHAVFVEEGASVECAILNTSEGPIYIGKDSEVMEGSIIRGPFALCDHGVVKMGAKIYSNTTLGPYCKAGGELNNVVMMGFSSKGHDGFLGNSVIGEWCNIGADSNNSNLKNNYAEVKLWDYKEKSFVNTGLQFCGLVMGDHSKCGINTMFNTGTVVGVNCNIYGSGFPRNYVPSFLWGGSGGYKLYQFEKAIETASKVMRRRGKEMDEKEQAILRHVFSNTEENRGNIK